MVNDGESGEKHMIGQRAIFEKKANEELAKLALGDKSRCVAEVCGPCAVVVQAQGAPPSVEPFGWTLSVWLMNDALGQPPHGGCLSFGAIGLPPDELLRKMLETLLEGARRERDKERQAVGGDLGRSLRGNPVSLG